MRTVPLRALPTSHLSIMVVFALFAGALLGPRPVTAAAAHAAKSAPAKPAARPAPPSPFAGHWEADMQGDGRTFTFVFDFTVKGDSLGGKLGIAGRDDEVKVAGLVRDHKLHFEQFGLWDGAIDGANLKLTRGLDGGKVQHMTAHRVARH